MSVVTQTERVPVQSRAVRATAASIVRVREQQQLADIQIRRDIFKLADMGVSQREIARLAGISQAEVSRRLSRRNLTSKRVTPREVILQRASGAIDSTEMLERLKRMAVSYKAPRKSAAYDGAATGTGTAKQIVAAYQEGFLSEVEYETIRTAFASRRKRASSR